jgi:hypothetical protein
MAPGYPGYPTYPGYGMQPPFVPPTPRGPNPLAKPFPLWLSALILAGSLVTVALVYFIAVLGARADWSGGAQAAGTVALLLSGAALIGLLVRVAVGRRAGSTIALGALLIIILAAAGGVSLATAPSLHAVQARQLEGSGQWQAAIAEFARSGEAQPDAPDIARVYVEWGEQLTAGHLYQQAIARFTTATTDYAESGDDLQSRAHTDIFTAYKQWIISNAGDVPYKDAIAALVAYRASADCDAACQQDEAAVEAQAHYQYGLQLEQQSQLADAIAQLETVQNQFKSSQFAAQAHTEAAKALLAYGQKQFGTSCLDAISLYRKLASRYADTPEGKQAQSALAKPQDVHLTLTRFPTNPTPTAHLSKHMNFDAFYFSNEYTALVDPSTGDVTFRNVAQGTYFLSTSRPVAGGIEYVTWYADSSRTSNFSFPVGPLCPVDLGQFRYS